VALSQQIPLRCFQTDTVGLKVQTLDVQETEVPCFHVDGKAQVNVPNPASSVL